MIKFSVPCDFKEESLYSYNELNNQYTEYKVEEVYGQLTETEFTASGRMINNLPRVNMKLLSNYIKLCNKYNIKFNYTLNASCMGNLEYNHEKQKRLRSFLIDLNHIGVISFTISLPSLFEIILNILPNIEIKASAICEINCPEKALHYKKLKIKRIVIDPDITLKFNVIKKICAIYEEDAEMIVNNVCMRNCAYKMFHYNHEAHCGFTENQINEQYYYSKCSLQKAQDLSSYIKLNWIRPEDLHIYNKIGIKNFKLQGRNNADGKNISKVLKYYYDGFYDGDLMNLLTLFKPYNSFLPYIDNTKLDTYIHKFVKSENSCSGLCDNCGYCLEFAKKSMNIKSLEALNKEAYQFYTAYSTFNI